MPVKEQQLITHWIQQSSFNGTLDRFQHPATVASSQDRERRVAQSPSIVNETQSPTNPPPKRPRNASPTNHSPSPIQKRRKSSKYAPPTTYAHLPKLKDIFTPNLICIFIGTNPGIRTATAGHAYAHPSNLFWRLLHTSGLTDRRCDPSEDVDMPRLYAMGNTNIVERPSKDAAQLSKAEMEDGARVLEAKMRQWKPEAVCIVGKGIWEAVVRAKRGTGVGKGWQYGWQDARDNMGRGGKDKYEGARVFVATSTSGLAVSTGQAEKEAIWKPFGEWVRKRRLERFGQEGEGDYLDELWKGNEELRAENEA
ncbi:MAG: hypothetical protein Q9165_003744 [Trypethelium subeluteriae]